MMISKYATDPVLFAKEVLGITLWERQAEVARMVVENRNVSVKVGHKVGSSTVCAVLGLWWVATGPKNSRAVLTAPAPHQINNILWPQVRALMRNAIVPIGGEFFKDPATGLRLSDERTLVCVTPDAPEKIAGLSGPGQLFIVDNADGVSEAIWDALRGLVAFGGRMLALVSG